MKRISLLLLLVLLCLAPSSFAAITSTVQWYVISGGAASNGGGFDVASAGTNYARIATPQVVIDNSTITATVTGSTITFTGGYTRYQITAADATTWTTDISTGATGATITSAKMGGAFAGAGDWLLPNGRANIATASAIKMWIKGATYTITTSWTVVPPATGTPTAIIEGYTSTEGDGGTYTLTSATDSVDLLTLNGSSTYYIFKNARLSHTASTRGIGVVTHNSGISITLDNVVIDGGLWNVNCDNSGARSTCWALTLENGTELKNSINENIKMNGGSANASTLTLRDSWVHGSASTFAGITYTTGTPIFQCYRSVVSSNGAAGVDWASSLAVARDTLFTSENCDYRSNTGSGVKLSISNAATPGSVQMFLRNNVFYGNGAYGVDLTTALTAFPYYFFNHNAYGGNVTANLHNLSAGTGDQTLSGDPFTSSTDFTPNSTTGAGALLRKTGYQPGNSVFGGTIAPDIGAVQASGGTSGQRAYGTAH